MKCKRRNNKSKDVTLEEFCYDWLEFKKKTKISKKTISRYKVDIELRIIPILKKYKLKDIKHYTIDKFKDRTSKSTTNKELSDKSKSEAFKLLKQILDKAVIWEKIRYNPANKIKTISYTKKEVNYYDEKNARKFIEELKKAKQPYRSIGSIGIFTGLRRGEINGLSWSNIDLKEKSILIDKQVLYSKEDWCLHKI